MINVRAMESFYYKSHVSDYPPICLEHQLITFEFHPHNSRLMSFTKIVDNLSDASEA